MTSLADIQEEYDFLDADDRYRLLIDLGRALVAARAEGVPWKLLVLRYGLCRTRLWQLWRAAQEAAAGTTARG